MNRDLFRSSILERLKIAPPSVRSEFHMEWRGGRYRPKSKNGIQVYFGERTPPLAASAVALVPDPPSVIEDRNYLKYFSYKPSDEELFTEPAKGLARLAKALDLPFRYGMPRTDVEGLARDVFSNITYGPELPYRSSFTTDPNDWTRGYTPQPGDVSSSCFCYEDGLFYRLAFWKTELTGIEVTDVEVVAMNEIEPQPLPVLDFDKPPRSFEAAAKMLLMGDVLESVLEHLGPTA